VKDFKMSDEFDENQSGAMSKRSCTDCIMCPVFVVFICGIVFCFIYGLSLGNPFLLTTAFDYDGNGCGRTEGFEDYKYLYWPGIDI
jgi:hypothetical protein